MGKRLQTRFQDVNQRIIKRIRKDKTKSERLVSKRKRKSSTDLSEPKEKISKNELPNKTHHSSTEINNEFNINNVYVGKLPKSKDIVLKHNEVDLDLLFSDELKNSYLNLINADFYFIILDEISLEGLDGITIEAFWKRFSFTLENFPCVIQSVQNFIWQNVITCSTHFKFYELPVTRKELEIFNRFDYMNTDIGVVMELAYELPDIYPPKPVYDSYVLGSCSTFDERVDISSDVINLTIGQAEDKYGLGLVIVAEQNLRTYAICGDLIDPLIAFLNTEYCMLERVGRSRKLGELTQGRMSIGSAFNMDPKSVYHYKKALYNSELISKQFFYIKSPLYDQNKTCSLLQLRRFYTNIRSHQSYMASEIINILKRQPGYRIESKHLREIYSDRFSSIGKLLKNAEFRKLVKLKIYPYKTVYPNATSAECTNKNRSEKNVSCYELLNPYVNVAAYWRDDRDESDEEDDEKEEEPLSGEMIYNMDTIRNVYYQILLSGDKGCTAADIRHLTGFDVNTVRTGLRKLNQKGVVNLRKIDIGKTRKYRYTVSVKKPDEPSSSNSSLTTTDKPKQSSVKARIMEKQKAALAKKKLETSIKPTPIEKLDNFLEIEIPLDKSYTFLIRNFATSISKIANPTLDRDDIRLTKNYAIDITYLKFNSNRLFDINKILDEINPSLKSISALQNFETFYISKFSSECIETTVLLLKATLGKVQIAKTFSEVESKPKTETPPLPDLTKVGSSVISRAAKLDYMGDHPVVDYYENENNITVEITASTTPEMFRFEKVYEKSDKSMTDRVYNRIQIILDLVNEMKIIEEMMKVHKLLSDIEAENGNDKKLDRKSLFRIIKRLVNEGYIKVYKLAMYNNAISKIVVFICHPSVNHMDDTIKSACQQIKWKFFTTSCSASKTTKPHVPGVQKSLENKIGKSPFSATDVLKSINELNKLNKLMVKEIHRKHRKTMGVIYGCKAKFARMRIMHEFLFYLVYNYNGSKKPLPREDVRKLFKSYRIELSEKDLNEIPNVYCNEISWKMFVPPLPAHAGWTTGWALVCDIILRFPLSVLLKIHNCCYEDSELLATLNHPVKRFYLVKDHSEIIRRTVFFKRKYLYDAYDTINRLVFCGLVQFGPKKYKEKDQLFIYVNRRATVKDTRSSGPGYNEVENKEYPTIPFYFNTLSDIDHYWHMLNSISLNTKLNAREPGQIVTLTYINTKNEFVESIKSRTPKEALLHDNGITPGDGKGACGLDSSLWPHLVRNWVWATKGTRSFVFTGLTNETLREIPPQTTLFNDLSANVIPKFYLPSVQNKGHLKNIMQPSLGCRNNKYTRIIQRRVKQIVKRQYNDEVDKKILKKLGTRRAKWLEQEEEYALLCKIGDLILNATKHFKKQIIPFTVVRDVLHRICPLSKYKTSRAIQRHWSKLQKRAYVGLENKVLNLFKLKPIAETFKVLLDKIGVLDEKTKLPFKLTEAEKSAAYVILMSYIVRNKKRIFDVLEGNLVNNDHLSEDNLKYTEETAVEIEKKEKKYFDPKNEVDIKKDIVKSVIHSSLCSKKITDFSVQLFKIYQNYPDALVKEAVKELRDNNLICYRTKKQRRSKVWDTPFCLSQFYIFFQYSTFTNNTAEEAFRVLRNVKSKRIVNFKQDVTALHNLRYGQLLGLNEFFTFYPQFELSFYLPQNTIVLNPDIADHDELVKELAVRYQLKLKMLMEGNENEIDFESEGDNDRTKSQDQDLILLEEDKEVSDIYEQITTAPTDNQDIPIDLTTDGNNAETINRLKTWITDCMTAESERRSPSPEFMIERSELHRNESENQENIRNEVDNDECGTGLRGIGSVERNLSQIPTLDEIKEGMLKTNIKDEERTIPHITELSDLLTKSFNDLKMDTTTLQNLKSHFITEYVKLDNIIINDLDQLQDNYMIQYIDSSMRNRKMWDKIENDVTAKDFRKLPNFEELIRNNCGRDEDIALTTEIIQFAAAKGILGASAQELKEIFLSREANCSLTSIIKHLMDAGILFQMGVASLTFVHYKYQHVWVVEQVLVMSDSASTSKNIELDQRLPTAARMKLMPWVGVNGQLDKLVLKNWISNVLSYTLDFPNVTFAKMCDKYCYIKPVDLFYIVQILEELGCVELLIYESRQEEDLFTNWVQPEKRYASFLDNLDDIVIQPNNVSMTCLGAFFCEQLNA